MRLALASLARNLIAGLRLSLFMPVTRLDFRIDLGQLLLLFLLSAAIDVVGDWTRTGPMREFSLFGAGTELYSGGLLLLASAVLALAFRQRTLAMAIPVIVLASIPVAQALNFVLPHFTGRSFPIEFGVAMGGRLLVLWMVAILIRCVAVAFAPPTSSVWLRALCGGLLLATPIWFSNSLSPNEPWWRDVAATVAPEGMSAGSEAVLAAQSVLLDQALSNLVDARPGVSDLYFVGFAPYSREDVFRKDVEAAQHVMDDRWGTAGRSVLLINNPQTLLTAPFATITNLRETLNEIGATIEPDDDVVMVYLASHGGRDFHLSADQPPLSLVELTPPGLRQLLDDAAIKWRIVVVSACYSGGFIEPLQDDNTLIITASRADRTSFGCGQDSEATFFGEAFFQKGMNGADSLAAAFEVTKTRVAQRERDGGFAPPSEPQWWIGPAMADKLKGMRKGRPTSGIMTHLDSARRDGWTRAAIPPSRLTSPPRAGTMPCRPLLSECK
ncbi:MAG: C13 family peptidase [Betaproteobacteria bacterium]